MYYIKLIDSINPLGPNIKVLVDESLPYRVHLPLWSSNINSEYHHHSTIKESRSYITWPILVEESTLLIIKSLKRYLGVNDLEIHYSYGFQIVWN